jgi:spermidine/putrescine transport system substrate-binding protein
MIRPISDLTFLVSRRAKDKAGNSYSAKANTTLDVSTIFNNINHIDDFNALMKKIDPEASTATAETSRRFGSKLALIQLKSDSFGLEVDSGKTDIISGDKSGIDTAWSGDAVTSLNNADELGNPTRFTIRSRRPAATSGSTPGSSSSAMAWKQEYAQKFIDFISRPDIAAANMDYIGYTSFIAGDDILELVRGWYDPRYSAMYVL